MLGEVTSASNRGREKRGILKNVFRATRNTFATLAMSAAVISPQNIAQDAVGYNGTYAGDAWAGVVAATSLSDPKPQATYVSGTWIVPAVSGRCEDRYNPRSRSGGAGSYDLSEWIGIGGALKDRHGTWDPTLIQTGTDSGVENGKSHYGAFFELLSHDGDILVPVQNFRVEPGDRIYASIRLIDDKKNQWMFYLRNLSRNHEQFSKIVTFRSSRQSAEWITERTGGAGNDAGMPRFGTVRFVHGGGPFGNYTTIGNRSGTISSFDREAVEITDGERDHARILARPSNLGVDGDSFNVTQSDCR